MNKLELISALDETINGIDDSFYHQKGNDGRVETLTEPFNLIKNNLDNIEKKILEMLIEIEIKKRKYVRVVPKVYRRVIK